MQEDIKNKTAAEASAEALRQFEKIYREFLKQNGISDIPETNS